MNMANPSAKVDVAITGIGGCFPQSANIEELKKKLMEQVDMVEPARWEAGQLDVCDRAGNLPNIDHFDAIAFGIHQKQVLFMDPMTRVLLEKTYEALIDAGINPMAIRGKKIGVYIGSSASEFDCIVYDNLLNGVGITGLSRSMIANRISFWLNITGPSISQSNSWLDGVQAMQTAFDAIRNGQIESAIVGACNSVRHNRPTHLYTQLGLTSKDGATRSFDEYADGYARSGGIVVYYLQRADLAKRIYATIINCNADFNGSRSGSFSNINVQNLSNFITDIYKESNVDPKDVQYVETYGCGIKIVDEKELEAIDSVFNKHRDEPLLIGSVKSNLGHTESSAFMLGIAKVIIAMETGIIPGTLNYQTPNKNIPSLTNGKLQVVSENKEWTPSLAAVNGFGLTGAFGHMLLKPNNRVKKEIKLDIPTLHILSTRTEEGMKEIIEDIKSNPIIDPEYSRIISDVFVTTISGHWSRGYVIPGENMLYATKSFDGSKRQIWFAYSGMGSQWKTMGKDLLKLPIFAQSIEKCHKVLESKKLNLKQIITDDDDHMFDNILHSFVGITAIQVGLTDILNAIGIVPDGMIGHSVGELGCAYADGCLTAEQVILSAYYRGRASQEIDLIPGMMAAVGKGAKEMKDQCPPSIDIACHNGPDSCTLSGPKEEMQTFVVKLQSQKIFARLVNVSNIAYHSRYIQPAAPLLLKYLKDIIPKPIARSAKWISTSVAESAWGTDLAKGASAEYLTNNLLSSVRFEEGSKHIPKNSVVIEIAPHGLLQAILKRSLDADCTNIPLTKRGSDDGLLFMCTALGQLYINGVDMDISPLYPHVEYPVSRGTRSLSNVIRWMHEDNWQYYALEHKEVLNSKRNYSVNLNCDEFRNLVGHRIGHDIVIPISTYLLLVCNTLGKARRIEPILIEDIVVKRHIVISEKDFTPPIFIMVQNGTGNFEVSDRYGIIILGRISVSENDSRVEISAPPILTEDLHYNFSKANLQNEFHYRGYQFRRDFDNVNNLNMYNEGSIATIEWKNDWPTFLNSMLQVNMLHAGEYENKPIMPTAIGRILIHLDRLPEQHKDVDISYHYKTSLLTSPIVQVKDVQFGPYLQEDKPLIADTYNFMKYAQDSQDIQSEMNMCLQIVQQTLQTENPLYIITEVNENEANSLDNYIYNYSDHHFASKIQLNILKNVKDNIPISALIIVGEKQLQNLHMLFKETTEFILVRLANVQQLSIDSNISVIRSFHVGEVQYHLLKEIQQSDPVIINIKSKCLNGSDLRNRSLPWAKQLHQSLNAADINKKNIYLVSKVLPENGIELFLNDVQNLGDNSNIRLVFLLDEDLPECHFGGAFYKEMFQKDLQVTVFKNGSWGSYFKTPYIKLNNENNTSISSHALTNMFHNYDVKYLGLNVEHSVPNESAEATDLGPVEFSGYDKSGQAVMGIARPNVNNWEMVPDPEFVWSVPDNWTLSQAATVPYAYACAYYVLFEVAELQPGDSILIHDGCSSFGQAVMQVAHAHNCNIYTTVGSGVERAILMNDMQMLSPSQIMSYTDTKFQSQLLESTNGKGVNVVISTLSGDGLQASLRCLCSSIGRVMVQVDLSQSDLTNSVGLNVFLLSLTMQGFVSKSILDKPHDIKSKIHAMLSDGIKKNVVQPLRTPLVTHLNMHRVISYLNSGRVTRTAVLPIDDLVQEEPQNNKSETISNCICKKDVSYIVCGDDTDMLIYTIRWLAGNGAKSITVFANIKSNITFVKRHLNSLKSQHNTDIKLILDEFPTTKMLRAIHGERKIGAVLILNRKSLAETIKYVKQVDAHLTTVTLTAHLICFWGNQIDMTYTRPDLLPVSNVKWVNSYEFSSAVRILADILDKPAEIVIRNDELSHDCSNNFSFKNFYALLSSSQDSIFSTIDSASTKTELIQLQTNGSPDVKEMLPAFIVPGLFGQKCKYFKSLLRKLLCPMYMINNGSTDSLQSVAAAAVKQIKQKRCNSYNIIGISFGGALALEIVKLLEEQGKQTQLYLIDGVPETIQNLINENDKKERLETSLLSSLLRINAIEHISSLRNVSNWDTRLQNALQLGNHTKKTLIKLTAGLNIIKNKLNQVLNYMPSEKTITGNVMLIRPQDSSQDYSYSLTNCCKRIQVEIIKGNHFTILETGHLANYINDTLCAPKLHH